MRPSYRYFFFLGGGGGGGGGLHCWDATEILIQLSVMAELIQSSTIAHRVCILFVFVLFVIQIGFNSERNLTKKWIATKRAFHRQQLQVSREGGSLLMPFISCDPVCVCVCV